MNKWVIFKLDSVQLNFQLSYYIIIKYFYVRKVSFKIARKYQYDFSMLRTIVNVFPYL